MKTKVSVKYLRISPRKARLVLNAIKGKSVNDAFDHLRFLNKKAARFTERLLKSAVASAVGKKMDEQRLYVDEVRSDGGPIFKRIMTRSMGRADRINKRTAHLTLVLGEKELTKKEIREQSIAATEEKPKKGMFKKKNKETKEAAKK